MRIDARIGARGRAASAAILVAFVSTLALAVALWVSLAPPRAAPAESTAAIAEPSPDAAERRGPWEDEATSGTGREPVEVRDRESLPVASPAAENEVASIAEINRRAEAAIASLRGAIETEPFSHDAYGRHARALANGLRAEAGRGGAYAIAAIAADPTRGERDTIAAAELLRSLREAGVPFPDRALAVLRVAWLGRAEEPAIASASVAALGLYGDAEDRRSMLESVSKESSPQDVVLASTGLAAARGDAAALEIAEAALASADPRRCEVALSVLTRIVLAADHGLSEEGRRRCAELLRGQLARAEPRAGETRIVTALAVLEPEETAKRLLAALSDPGSSDGERQTAAIRLATIPSAVAELESIAGDGGLPDVRRAYAIEALVRAGRELSADGRGVLERVRDRGPDTPAGKRAAHVLAQVERGRAK